uniref:Armadillo repeat-containing domain-containing protein n=1 Tax=Leptobrachium leishanense TaxID=445787 RepID=A0A8C5QG91_9ANUR
MAAGGAAVRALVGLSLGAAICYCVYKVMWRYETKKKQKVGDGRLGILSKVSGIPVKSSVQSDAADEFENNPQSVIDLQPHHLKMLIEIVSSSSNASLREKALVTLGNCAAFTRNVNIISNLNGIQVIGAAISDEETDIRISALNALNNLSLNIENQDRLKDYLHEVCETITSAPLNSELQFAGLRLLINMAVFYDHHKVLAEYIPFFLTLLAEGNIDTQIWTSKVLVNLSLNSSMATFLFRSKAPRTLDALFDLATDKELLFRLLSISANLYASLGTSQNRDEHIYGKDSLYTLLLGDSSGLKQNLLSLLQIPQPEIQNQVMKLILMCNSKRIKYNTTTPNRTNISEAQVI